MRRRAIYIVPSLTGLLLSIFVALTYSISFPDQNPWLASLALAGFAWFVVSLNLTHRRLAQLEIQSSGKIRNMDGEAASGICVNGKELEEIPAGGSVCLRPDAGKSRLRISTSHPSGLFYSWTFLTLESPHHSDLGEAKRFELGSPWARVDWKFALRRGLLRSRDLLSRWILRPNWEAVAHDGAASGRRASFQKSDASVWAFLLSLLLFVALAAAGMHLAPLWSGMLVLVWAFKAFVGIFSNARFRYWGFLNFFMGWLMLVLVIVAGKAVLLPWMITTPTTILVLLPLALHLRITSTQTLLRRLMNVGFYCALTLLLLYTSRSFINERFQSARRAFYGRGASNDIDWGASLSRQRLKAAERFLARGQAIFWVPFSRELQVEYVSRLPYWRENTFNESRAGLNWSGRVMPADAGRPVAVNLFLPGREALYLQRQAPKRDSEPLITAYDEPAKDEGGAYSLPIRSLAKRLKLSARDPEGSAKQVIEWMRSENFRYSFRPGRMASIEEFVFDKKIGLCQHYAGALAYILRAADMKTRVVVGYQGGELNPQDQTLIMRDYDAHAWVELWIPDKKFWILLDPTLELFPSEYRNVKSKPLLQTWTHSVVKLQNAWARIYDGLKAFHAPGNSIPGILVGVLVLFLVFVFFKGRQLSEWHSDERQHPRVKKWERKMQRRFLRSRGPAEPLQSYFRRVTEGKTLNSEKLLALRDELQDLQEELYGPQRERVRKVSSW